MEIFGFKTIDSLPALYHEESDLVVISDLHLGLEESMTFKGGYVPQFQLEDLKDDIKTIKQETGASSILVNGDLKHEFKKTSYSERKEIEEFIEFLKEHFSEIIIVEGNHDTFLEKVVEKKGAEFVEEYRINGILFSHGHRKISEPESFDTVVIGHEHPALELKDEIGVTEKVDCFLYGETEKGQNIIVMPAFSKISGGSKVNQVPQNKLLSPVLRNQVDIQKLKAVAVSREAGIYDFPEIGKI